MTFPAFKEWHVIVEALGAGEQVLIFRKGGIAEGRNGFQVQASRFWLFPTRFHAQLEKTKPAAARWFDSAANPADPDRIHLRYFADAVRHAFVTDWNVIAQLDPHHLWTLDAIRERFDWSRPAGIHVFALRIHKLATPVPLPLTSAMGGCKSWIELPCDFESSPSTPVLGDAAFQARLACWPPLDA